MPDEWLFEVLRDVEDYAVLNDLDWLVPLINKVNVAAKTEMGRSCAPKPERLDEVTRLTPGNTKGVRSAGSPTR